LESVYILDTSVYLTDADCVSSFSDGTIVIPLKVLDEIDKNKKRQDPAGVQARKFIRYLDSLREVGNLCEGVETEYSNSLVVRSYDPFALPDDLNLEDSDNQIIATALSEKKINKNKNVVLVSRDINMRVKCDALGLESRDYKPQKVIPDAESIFAGFVTHLVDEQVIDSFYAGEDVFIDKEEVSVHPNQFIMLISNSNDKKSALARFENYFSPLVSVRENKRGVWGVSPRNKEQSFALDLLMDPDVVLVTLVGRAGSGKTLLALAAALEQTFSTNVAYKKIVVTKPVQPVGKDIGFLPGSMQEKMMPWLAPIQDNLQYLFGNDKMTLDMHVDEGRIEIEAMTFIRGRSIANAFIIVDEVQNMSQHEIKTILTRVGEGTKVVLTGDVDQIDNLNVDSVTNGLTYVVEKFKDQKLSGHVTLQKGERSKIASIASKIL